MRLEMESLPVMSGLSLMLGASNPADHVVAHELIHGTGFTNHHLMGLVAAVLVFVTFFFVGRASTPKGADAESYVTRGRFAQLFEVLAEFIRERVVRPNLGDLTDKYIYYIWTVFFFILFMNVLGMIPFGPALALVFRDDSWSHWGGTATGNIAVTGAMATLSLIVIVGIGVHEQGMKYFAHFAPVPFTPLPMAPLAAFLVVLEVFSLLIKCTVLAVRLFGTMMAGHLVVAAVLALITTWAVGGLVLVSLTLLNLLELFVAFLQAFIFTFLTTLFIAAGAVHHDDHGHEHASAAH